MKVCIVLGSSTEPKNHRDYLQHVSELFNFEINRDDTYLSMFDRMLKSLSDRQEHQAAVQALFDHNKNEYEGTDTLSQVVWDDDYESERQYINLNFKDSKE